MDFIKSVLGPYLSLNNIDMMPKMIGSKPGLKGGGNVTIGRLVNDMSEFYMQDGAVTSLVDFYGFAGKGNRNVDELETYLMDRIKEKIGYRVLKNRRLFENMVIPYVQKHEFESLLFSDTNAFSSVPGVSAKSIKRLSGVSQKFVNPEEINDSPKTAPSKRIENIISRYNKRSQGPLVAEKIGIDKIRSECPRFNEWLNKLEALGRKAEVFDW